MSRKHAPASAETAPATLFAAAAELLRANIHEGRLQPGVVLQESALSERLSMSRATVKRALALLADEGLVGRFSGRGYIVSGADTAPRRLDLRQMDLDLGSLDDTLGKPNWLRIQDEVEAALSRCLIFGRYRVVEVLLAREFQVSRTVVRDVLSRLQERGLVQKSASSRWVVEPLTARRVRDKFDLRMVLEMAALRTADADTEALAALADEMRALPAGQPVDPDTWFAFEQRFFELAILATPNRDLASYISTNRSALAASQQMLFSLGLQPDPRALLELCMVIDLLRAGTIPAAESMLATHLRNALDRTIAQLKIVSVLDPPDDLAPYLLPA